MARSGFTQNLSPIKETQTPSRQTRASSRASPAPSTTMSTRRTARGTSKVPSEVASGVSGASGATATPRRRARQTGPLPAVGTKTSNAYGTNAVQSSARATGPQVADQISGVLDDLLDPLRPSRTPSKRGSVVGTGDPISFGNESGLFGAAHVASTMVSQEDLSMIEEEVPDNHSPSSSPSPPSPARSVGSTPTERAQSDAIRQTVRGIRINRAPLVPRSVKDTLRGVKDSVFAHLHLNGNNWAKFILPALVALVLLGIFASQLPRLHWHGLGPSAMKHNFGQVFASGDLDSLQYRVAKVERDVFQLQQRGTIHDGAINRLQTLLPDFIVGTKDKSGRIILPNGLWQAIESKIQSEHPLAFGNIGGKSVPTKDVDNQINKSLDLFLKSNDFKSKAIDSRFSHLIDQAHNNNIVISKADAIKLIRESWEDNKSGIKPEMSKLRKDLQDVTESISKLKDGPQTKEEIQAIAKDVFAKMLTNAQLRALSKVHLDANLNYGLTRVNHFSQGTGAVINSLNISPNFVFPQMKLNIAQRLARAALNNPVPTPKGPIEALRKWEEHGDCWCSPADAGKGFGPSLAVIMGSNIYPEEVVIEHIQSSAAIEPGSAPKELELLAFIPNLDDFTKVKAASKELFPEDTDSIDRLPPQYVRIATFMYDKNSNNIQAFPVQLDTKLFSTHTNKLIMRAKSNWGSVPYTCLYRVRVHGAIVHTPGIY